MATNVNINYKMNLSRLDWLELQEHIDKLYIKLEVFQSRGDEKNADRILECLHYAEEELNERLTDD